MPTTDWIYWIICGVTSGDSSGGGTNCPSWPYQIFTWQCGECSGLVGALWPNLTRAFVTYLGTVLST
eukprot:4609862-Ditylum_brightwellii.AAC.1